MEELTSKKVEQTGIVFYTISRIGMIFGVISIALAILIGLISIALGADFISPFVFRVADSYAFAYLFVIVDYFFFIWGLVSVFFYFIGLHLFALGRIAVNTEVAGAITKANAPKAQPQPEENTVQEETLAPNQKKCWACGTVQNASNRFCISCSEQL